MKKILITGHSGFIGSNLVNSISDKSKLIGLSTKYLPASIGIKQIKKNILKTSFNQIPNISHIIHLAALTDIKFCQKNPSKCFEVNIRGTAKILELARKRDCKVIFLSTSHVFGKPQFLPINEDHPRIANSIYSASKISGEVLCESYSKSYGIDISIIRLFSIYGPNSPSHLVTNKIISQLLKKNTIKLGNVKTKRDFLYVDDAINAIKIVLKKTHDFNSFNVGTGKSTSILDICKILQKFSQKRVKIESQKSLLRKDDIKDMRADIHKIKKIGWKPKTNLEQGLKQTFYSYSKFR